MHSINAAIGAVARLGIVPASLQSRYIRKALELLRDNFDLVPVTNAALADEARRIRYEVFCQRHNIFNAADFPDHKEHDIYDEHALQVLLRFKKKSLFIGAIRTIMPLPGENYPRSFPTQEACDVPLFKDKDYIARVCEVSRFCLSHERRDGLEKYLSPKLLAGVKPVLKVGLIAGLIKTTQEHGYDRLCGVLEPWLIDGLEKMGWQFNKIGPLVTYHGLRQPCEGSITEALEEIKAKRPEIWDYIVSMPPLWSTMPARTQCH